MTPPEVAFVVTVTVIGSRCCPHCVSLSRERAACGYVGSALSQDQWPVNCVNSERPHWRGHLTIGTPAVVLAFPLCLPPGVSFLVEPFLRLSLIKCKSSPNRNY